MKISIVRDGQEIGEYTQEDIDRLLSTQFLRSTDLYWHEGMEDWKPLSSLGIAVAQPEIPRTRSSWLRVAGICLAVCLAIYAIQFAVRAFRDAHRRTAASSSEPAGSLASTPGGSPAAPAGNSAAAAASPLPAPGFVREAEDDLKQRLAKLSEPSEDYLYSDVAYEIRSADSPTTLRAFVTGKEHLLERGTNRSIWVTDFTLTLTYQGGRWLYEGMKGTVLTVADFRETPFDEGPADLHFSHHLVKTIGAERPAG